MKNKVLRGIGMLIGIILVAIVTVLSIAITILKGIGMVVFTIIMTPFFLIGYACNSAVSHIVLRKEA